MERLRIIGILVRLERKRLGYTQQRLGRAVGCSQTQLSKLESGKGCDSDLLLRVLLYLHRNGINLCDLFEQINRELMLRQKRRRLMEN